MMHRQYQTYVRVITTLLLLFGLIDILYSSSVDSGLFFRLRKFDGYLNKKYNLTSLTPVKSKSDCARSCMQNSECVSFFYLDNPQNLCQTHSALSLTTDEAEVTPNSSYYQLTQARCPHEKGYILYRPVSLCYKYFPANVTWDEANEICQANQTHLIDVKNTRIYNHLTSFLKASTTTRMNFVSVGGRFSNKDWRWSDGTRVVWRYWFAGSANPLTKGYCLAMNYTSDFKIMQINCNGSIHTPFLCQLDL